MDSFETICKNATTEWLEKMQNQYKHLVEFNSGEGKIYNKKLDKYIEPGRMPWMVKCYQSGLDIVTNELNNRGANNKDYTIDLQEPIDINLLPFGYGGC